MSVDRFEVACFLSRRLPGIWAWRIGRRVCSFSKARHLPHPQRRIRTITGSPINLRCDDFIGYIASLYGCYDWVLVGVAKATVPPGGCIVEVGANIGTETVCFGDIVGPCGHVIALEPVPTVFEQLVANVYTAGQSHVRMIQSAASDFEGTVTIEAPSSDNSGVGRIADSHALNDGLTVPCRRMDSMLDIPSPVHLLTVDVEGHELLVLQGADNLIARDRPIVAFEFTYEATEDAVKRADEFLVHFAKLDYHVYVTLRGVLVPYDLTQLQRLQGFGEQNWFALPAERTREILWRLHHFLRQARTRPHILGLNPLSRRIRS